MRIGQSEMINPILRRISTGELEPFDCTSFNGRRAWLLCNIRAFPQGRSAKLDERQKKLTVFCQLADFLLGYEETQGHSRTQLTNLKRGCDQCCLTNCVGWRTFKHERFSEEVRNTPKWINSYWAGPNEGRVGNMWYRVILDK